MGNLASQLLSNNSTDAAETERLQQKIEEAVAKKHLKIPNLNLTRIPRILTSEALREELNVPLKSIDIHGNPLHYVPNLNFPNLTTLNLWGNNMTNEMFAPYGGKQKRGVELALDQIRRTRKSISMIGSNPTQQQQQQQQSPAPIEIIEENEQIEKGAFSLLIKLDCLDLGNNQLTSIPLSIKKCVKLTQLTLTGNFLQTKENIKIIENLNELNILELDINNFEEIPDICLLQKEKLFSLVMRGNKISFIPENLNKLKGIQTLNLADNEIIAIENSAFSGLSKLKHLYLFHNFLSSLPADFFCDLNSLNTLMLQGNQLKHLPPLDGLNSLRVLNVSYNVLIRLPEVSNLQNLTQLDVSHNRLLALPSSIENIIELRNLDASYNELTQLPLSFIKLSHLTQLNLIGNFFTSGGKFVINPNDFKKDIISDGIQPIWSISSLETLHLALNNIKNLPHDAFSNLKRLKTLNLAFNNLFDDNIPIFDCFSKLPSPINDEDEQDEVKQELVEEGESPQSLSIENIFLNGNHLNQFPIKQLLPLKNSLQVLSLDGNKIQTIPEEIQEFKKLTRFSISAPYQEKSSSTKESNSNNSNALQVPNENGETGVSTPRSRKRRTSTNKQKISFKYLSGLQLSRFYIGSYYEGKPDAIGLQPIKSSEDKSNHYDEILPKLEHSDVKAFSAFPHFSCSLENVGSLKSIPYGYSLCTGTSHDLEDCVHFRSLSLPNTCGSQNIDYIALFDGHGGSEVALFIQQHLAPVIESYLRQFIEKENLKFNPSKENSNLVANAIIKSYIETNGSLEQWLKATNIFDKYVGSTCITIILTDQMLYCANVGDSRAVLGTFSTSHQQKEIQEDEHNDIKNSSSSVPIIDSKSVQDSDISTLFSSRLSFDHKPNVREERIRIRQNGGVVISSLSGTCSYRISKPCGGPTLAVSRSFGDFHLYPVVSVQPDVFCHPLEPSDQFFVVASDGLWDVLSDKMCIDIVAELLYHLNIELNISLKKSCEIAASHVRDLVFSLGSGDDLSVIIVPLRWNESKCMEKYFEAPNSYENDEFPKQPKKKKKKKPSN